MKKVKRQCGMISPLAEKGKSLKHFEKEERGIAKSVLCDMEHAIGKLQKLEIKIDGNKAVVCLEEPILQILKEIAKEKRVDLFDLCADIISVGGSGVNIESRLRAYAVDYLRGVVIKVSF